MPRTDRRLFFSLVTQLVTVQYSSTDDSPAASIDQAEKTFGNAVIAYHKQVFTAAGTLSILCSLFYSPLTDQMADFENLRAAFKSFL